MSAYTIKVTGHPRYSGEYESRETLAESIAHARESFLPGLPAQCSLHVVTFDFSTCEDGAPVIHETIQWGTL